MPSCRKHIELNICTQILKYLHLLTLHPQHKITVPNNLQFMQHLTLPRNQQPPSINLIYYIHANITRKQYSRHICFRDALKASTRRFPYIIYNMHTSFLENSHHYEAPLRLKIPSSTHRLIVYANNAWKKKWMNTAASNGVTGRGINNVSPGYKGDENVSSLRVHCGKTVGSQMSTKRRYASEYPLSVFSTAGRQPFHRLRRPEP